MRATESENIITNINANVFFKEFTFHKNNFYPKDGKKELADNVLWLDDLIFIIQIKERDHKKGQTDVNDWFKNKVLKKAKEQICNSIDYFNKYENIPVKNCRNQLVDVSNASLDKVKKVIVYKVKEQLNDYHKSIKFYESQKVGNIHVFCIEDYYWICRYLVTPSEVDEYLDFRERLYLKHKRIIGLYPEQYILGHFLNTTDIREIKEEYVEILKSFEEDLNRFDISGIIESYLEKIRIDEQKESLGYHLIITEIAKLKREELVEFKNRFMKALENAHNNIFTLPNRFLPTRTMCGFVFISLETKNYDQWNRALINFTEIYKYKHKLKKCLGVVIVKKDDYFDINWTFFNSDWKYDKELEQLVAQEAQAYGDSEIVFPKRYNN